VNYRALCAGEERLENLGSTQIDGAKLRSEIRTDYVGWEIDRFFRISKHCKPRVLAMGDALLGALDSKVNPIGDIQAHLGLKVLEQRVPHQAVDGWSTFRTHIVTQELRPDELKGIGESYKLHHLFGIGSLGAAAFMPMPAITSLMEPTRAFLAENGFYAIPADKRLP
jgi:hypothetical protein